MYIKVFGLHDSPAIFRVKQERSYWLELPLEVLLCIPGDQMRILLGFMAGIRQSGEPTSIFCLPLVRSRLRRHYSGGDFWQQVGYFLRPPAPPIGFVPPRRGEVMVSKIIGAVCFFWMFYIFRKDGATIFGLKDPFSDLYELDYDKNYVPLARHPLPDALPRANDSQAAASG